MKKTANTIILDALELGKEYASTAYNLSNRDCDKFTHVGSIGIFNTAISLATSDYDGKMYTKALVMKEAVEATARILKSGDPAIIDTIWADDHTTLLDLCEMALDDAASPHGNSENELFRTDKHRPEMRCPDCGNDMKEYVNQFKCRSCGLKWEKAFTTMSNDQTSDDTK